MEMIPLTIEETESCKKQKVYHIWKKEFSTDKKYRKSEITVITQENLEQLLIIIAI